MAHNFALVTTRHSPRISEYIMTFHVSTGKSASLKLQSKTSAATGSSVGSWYGARYSCDRASVAEIRVRGSKTSIFSSRSSASGSALANFVLKGTFSRFGSDWTNRRVWTSQLDACSAVENSMTHVLRGNGLDDIVRGRTEQLGDDGELVDV